MNKQTHNYIKKGYKKIEGWYSQDALELIAELNDIQISNNISGSLCEIGIHHGRSFILLSLLVQTDEMCLGIDLFGDQDQNIDNSGCGDKEIVVSNLKSNNCDINKVKFITNNSLNLTPNDLFNSSGQKFRFISLDGGHTAEIIQNDLQLAESVLCNGGVVLVDDYFDERWPGVSEGTLRHLLVKKSDLIPFAIFDDKILFTNNIDIKSIYIREMQNLVPKYIIKEANYMNEICLIIYSSPSKLKNTLRKTKLWQSVKSNNIGNNLRSVLRKL